MPFFSTICQWHFFFSTSCSVASLVFFCLDAKEPGIGMGHANTGKGLEVLLFYNDSGFLLLIGIPYRHDQSCQLGSQSEFFRRVVFFLGG